VFNWKTKEAMFPPFMYFKEKLNSLSKKVCDRLLSLVSCLYIQMLIFFLLKIT